MTAVVLGAARTRQPWGYVVLGQSIAPTRRDSNNSTDATVAKLDGLIIPGGTLRENSLVRVWSVWTYTNSGNQKNLIPRLGTNSLGQTGLTTTATAMLTNAFWAQSSMTAQRAPNNTAVMGGNTANTLISMTYDMKVDQEISFNCSWNANVLSEFIQLEKWLVEAFL